jgi:hypothetical protein
MLAAKEKENSKECISVNTAQNVLKTISTFLSL